MRSLRFMMLAAVVGCAASTPEPTSLPSRPRGAGPCVQTGYHQEQLAWRMTLSYDDRGRLRRTERDANADGRIDSRRFYHYNPAGRVVIQERDGDGDGRIDKRRSLEYDADGRVVARLVDVDADGTPERRTVLERDGRGRIVLERGDDGSSRRTSYDARGCATASVTMEGTSLRSRRQRRCNARNQVVLERVDLDGDGTFERETRHTYTASGQPIVTEIREGPQLRARYEMRYTQDGLWIETRTDRDGDGTFEARTVADYSCWASS